MFSSHNTPWQVDRINIDLDLHLVDGLHEPGLGGEHAGVEDTSGGGDDLAAAAVDGVSGERHVVQVKPDRAHVLVTQHTLEQIIRVSPHVNEWFAQMLLHKAFEYKTANGRATGRLSVDYNFRLLGVWRNHYFK